MVAIPADGEGDDYAAKEIQLAAHDGKLKIWINDGDDAWSVSQAERLSNLLPDVVARARAYRPKPWMLDPNELRRKKQLAYESCRVVLSDDPVSD